MNDNKIQYKLRHHLEMLHDRIRCRTYSRAVEKIVKDKIVLDVGCGTGILSFFAARSGAKKVYSVDINLPPGAEQAAIDNGFENIICFIPGRIEEISLPVESVDVIISEWMGGLLLMENMLPALLYARDRWLKPGGYLLPDRAKIFFAPLSNSAGLHSSDFPELRKSISSKMWVTLIDPNAIVAKECCIADFDLTTICMDDILSFNKEFEFSFQDNSLFDSFAIWFDVIFSTSNPAITLSTAPWNPPTHWQQGLGILPIDIKVNKCKSISGKFSQENLTTTTALYHISLYPNSQIENEISFHVKADSASMNPAGSNDSYECSQAVNGAYKDLNCLWIGCSWSFSPMLASKHGAKSVLILNHSAWAQNAMKTFAEEENLKNIQFINSITELENLKEKKLTLLGSSDGSWHSLISHIKVHRLISNIPYQIKFCYIKSEWKEFYGFDLSAYEKYDLEMYHEQEIIKNEIELVDITKGSEHFYQGAFGSSYSNIALTPGIYNCVKVNLYCGIVVLPLKDHIEVSFEKNQNLEYGTITITIVNNDFIRFQLSLKNCATLLNQSYEQPLNYLGRIM